MSTAIEPVTNLPKQAGKREMPISKRIFDVTIALLLIVILAPVLLILILLVLMVEGRPVLYVSERMRSTTHAFKLFKLRTMKHDPMNTGVTGGYKSNRSSRLQQILRKTRLDELPQLWNVLRGDMSFVGPRPPLRQMVEASPIVYNEVLKARPGVTGLASLRFHHHEEMLLKDCKTSEETDHVYKTRCIPRKAALDLMYAKNWSLCFDVKLMIETAAKPFQR